MQAYSPLGSGAVLREPLLASIGAAHHKTAAQVALRYILQKNVTIATQSTEAAHLREDVAIFGWSLSQGEVDQLDQLRAE